MFISIPIIKTRNIIIIITSKKLILYIVLILI